MPHSFLLRWFCRAYRLLLYAYPRDFRVRCGAEMAQVFGDRCRSVAQSQGLFGLLRFGAHSGADWLISTIRERIASMRTTAELNGTAQPVFDGIPIFYTAESYSPRVSALINGGVLSMGIFMGLYLTMAHWKSHVTPLLTGSHHHSRFSPA